MIVSNDQSIFHNDQSIITEEEKFIENLIGNEEENFIEDTDKNLLKEKINNINDRIIKYPFKYNCQGIWVNGNFSGVANEKYKNDIIYEGNFEDGLRNGKGKIKSKEFEFVSGYFFLLNIQKKIKTNRKNA